MGHARFVAVLRSIRQRDLGCPILAKQGWETTKDGGGTGYFQRRERPLTASGVGSGEAVGFAVGPHLPLLAGQDAQVAERLSPAK